MAIVDKYISHITPLGSPDTYKIRAIKLGNSDIGSATLPIYLDNGTPKPLSNNSVLINLASETEDSIYKTSPRPGITGTLSIVHGGTSAITELGARQNLDVPQEDILSYYSNQSKKHYIKTSITCGSSNFFIGFRIIAESTYTAKKPSMIIGSGYWNHTNNTFTSAVYYDATKNLDGIELIVADDNTLFIALDPPSTYQRYRVFVYYGTNRNKNYAIERVNTAPTATVTVAMTRIANYDATKISPDGTAAQFWRGDNKWSNELLGGLLKITNNSNTVTIGSRNTDYMHFYNSANIPFYFNQSLWVDGDLYPYGTSNTRSLGSSSKRWKNLLIGTADSYGGTTQPIWWNAGVPTAITTAIATAYGGTGNNTFIKNRLVWTSEDTKLSSTTNLWTDGTTIRFLKEGNHSYPLLQNTYDSVVYDTLLDYQNGNIVLNAASSGLYLGYRNTTYIDFINSLGRWTNTGLGVGTTSPDYKLHVAGMGYFTNTVHINKNSQSGTIDVNTAPLLIGTLTKFNLAIGNNGIQARNDSAASTLYFNQDSGSIQFGSSTSKTAPTKIFGAVTPGVNATYDLGTTDTLRWKSGFFTTSLRVGAINTDTGTTATTRSVYIGPDGFYANSVNVTSATQSNFVLRGKGKEYAKLYIEILGAADTAGRATLILGNSTESTAADNAYGELILYSHTTKYSSIESSANIKGHHLNYLPIYNATGTSTYYGRLVGIYKGTSSGSTSGFDDVGSISQPVYVTANGIVKAISLKPTLNNLLSSLDSTADTLVDAGYIISTNNNGATNDWYLRSNITIWNYIKGKYSSTDTTLNTGPIHIRSTEDNNNALVFDRASGEYQYIQSKNPDNNISIVFAESNSDSNTTYRFTKDEFYPKTNNSKNLGLSENKWANVYATNFNGALKGNADTATILQTAQTINGTSFDGSANITTAKWGTAKTLTIGNKGQSVDGSANVSWALQDILIRAGNEFNYTADGLGHLWFNYKTQTGTVANTAIAGYHFGNGQSSSDDVTLYATAFSGNAATATKLSNTPNNTTTFLRGDNTWSNTLTKTFISTASPGFQNNVSAGSWSFLRLNNGSNLWDIATKSDDNSGALQFRSGDNENVLITTAGEIITPKATILANLGVNGANDSYNLYVNGTTFHTSNVYFGNGTTYFINNSAIGYLPDLRVAKTRLTDNWLGFYENANASGNRYGFISANANRMYFKKENGVSTYHFDFNGHIYTSTNIYAGTTSSTTTREIHACAAAGDICLYSQGSATGSRGIWLASHGTGPARNIFNVNTDNITTYYGGQLMYRTITDNTSHALALKTEFDNHKADIPKSQQISYYSSAMSNGSIAMGYFLSGHDDEPFGGFFVAHYNVPRYVGISRGTYTQWRLLKGADSGAIGGTSTPIYIDSNGIAQPCTAYNAGTDIRAATVNIHDDTTSKLFVLGATTTGYTSIYRESSVYMQDNVLMGAAWNDYAEFRQSKENKKIESGRVVYENGDDTLSMSNERLMRGCNIVSDTYGFGIGESEEAQLPIAVSGRVLAYPYEDREEFKNYIGWPVCSGPNGTVSIMTEEEEMKYPSRIIGTISAVPDYKVWHGGADVIVDGRVWIKVR